ncbi:MAG: glycine cleavage system protein GcvH [Alphaproteobacteria bacterium]|jgi:glycine cleavage system H protein|nr:glycine cleavage system protein GcvH [Rhodospirillaceae bacterium]MDG2480214.1 glycine cleavage system protein GcvH [Alphaproteobacteria bacterium]MBT6204856.1 glycine cleavage system protein GcvH [Rhodospirillaceae bacterium]MBT6509564.1 glycine cleavage system protein GcvH [Rhodospirillaceae bacterium]MBT7613908.1 glycine cleavage system protein GcvH [Rhodospirillaceae bacterium]
MSDRLYSKDHEWIEMDGDIATVGISEHAQEQLGDVVFVELPDIGRSLSQNEEAGVVESVKAASELYAPLAGEIVEVNETLVDDPAQVNADPYGNGWFMRVRIDDTGQLDGLMDEEAYQEFLAELE